MDKNIIELDGLKGILAEVENHNRKGYIVDFDTFKSIYEFARRTLIRNPKNISMVLYTLKDEAEKNVDEFISVISESLRREDVISKYNDNQIVVLLVNSDYESTIMVARRTINNYNKKRDCDVSGILYDVFQLDVKKDIDAELGKEYGERFRDRCCIYNNQWVCYCIGYDHVKLAKYEESGKILRNNKCLKCGYEWTTQVNPDNDTDIKVICEGEWWSK